jgi:hypothetical protein
MPVRTTPTTIEIVLLCAAVVAIVIVSYVVDRIFARFLRNVVDTTFRFPKSYRVPMETRNAPEMRWVRLTVKVGDLVTNKLYSATSDAGLAFEMRSPFGFPMMHTVVVPWSAIRLDERHGDIHVLDEFGVTVNTIDFSAYNPRWRDLVIRRAPRGDLPG